MEARYNDLNKVRNFSAETSNLFIKMYEDSLSWYNSRLINNSLAPGTLKIMDEQVIEMKEHLALVKQFLNDKNNLLGVDCLTASLKKLN